MPSPTEITIAQLAALVGTPACPVLIDICIDEDFAADPRFIPGAIRHPFTEIEASLGISAISGLSAHIELDKRRTFDLQAETIRLAAGEIYPWLASLDNFNQEGKTIYLGDQSAMFFKDQPL